MNVALPLASSRQVATQAHSQPTIVVKTFLPVTSKPLPPAPVPSAEQVAPPQAREPPRPITSKKERDRYAELENRPVIFARVASPEVLVPFLCLASLLDLKAPAPSEPSPPAPQVEAAVEPPAVTAQSSHRTPSTSRLMPVLPCHA